MHGVQVNTCQVPSSDTRVAGSGDLESLLEALFDAFEIAVEIRGAAFVEDEFDFNFGV